jgi:hypothetical protein
MTRDTPRTTTTHKPTTQRADPPWAGRNYWDLPGKPPNPVPPMSVRTQPAESEDYEPYVPSRPYRINRLRAEKWIGATKYWILADLFMLTSPLAGYLLVQMMFEVLRGRVDVRSDALLWPITSCKSTSLDEFGSAMANFCGVPLTAYIAMGILMILLVPTYFSRAFKPAPRTKRLSDAEHVEKNKAETIYRWSLSAVLEMMLRIVAVPVAVISGVVTVVVIGYYLIGFTAWAILMAVLLNPTLLIGLVFLTVPAYGAFYLIIGTLFETAYKDWDGY